MFTGIITDVGEVGAVDARASGRRLTVVCAYDPASVDLGASIACSGACLTVVEKGEDGAGRGWFMTDVSAETLACTTLDDWTAGTAINLERSLTPSSELGGHIVLGHVDGVGRLLSIRADGDSRRLEVGVPGPLARFVASKGAIAVDGVSLTVNEVADDRFGVNIIPHTWENTAFNRAHEGQPVNLEVDVIARYAARLLAQPE